MSNIKVYAHYGVITAVAQTSDKQIIGTAESSLVGEDNTYYFNRILVQPRFRGKGYGSKLLEKLLKEFNKKGYKLICEINPYGPLNYEQLKSWYKRHGFVEDTNTGGYLIFRGAGDSQIGK